MKKTIQNTRSRMHGFTLVELLVVVSIIAILASIAIPNFLEAQTRAKVARMVADMRSVATALEAYRLDNSGYPIRQSQPGISGGQSSIPIGDTTTRASDTSVLTTPISYIQAIPVDIFESTEAGTTITAGSGSYDWETEYSIIEYWDPAIVYSQLDWVLPADLRGGLTLEDLRRVGETYTWALLSVGPDGEIRPVGSQSNVRGGRSNPISLPGRIGSDHMNEYDPTNGTVSRGNIYRFNSQKNGTQFFFETEVN